MRLRVRLLLLIALLLAGVLAGSFAWIFSDLRSKFSDELDDSLRSALVFFKSGELQRFRTLEVMASSLESSPSFRNVLRQTDQATLVDFAESTAEGLQIDLILVSDELGKVQARTGTPAKAEHPAAAELRGWAGQTSALRHYWWLDGALYQGVTVPMVDSQDYIDGYLSLGYRFDQTMLERLAKELDSRLELRGRESVLTSDPSGDGRDHISRTIPLGNEGQAPGVAELVVARSLAPIEGFVRAARVKLLTLASAAFLLALAVSYPLVGRVANPLEALQRAEAEMAAIFGASLDGLVSFDEVGRVSMANPAAAVALGRESSTVVGLPLFDLLPESVVRDLTITPAGVQQQADYQRAGRLYKLHRSFVRPRESMQLGSILLFHDVTEERHRERRVSSFLEHLCQRLEIPDSPWRVRVGLATLAAWSKLGNETPPNAEVSEVNKLLSIWVEEFSKSFAGDRPCRLETEVSQPESAALAVSELRLLVEILLENAVVHGQGEIVVGLRRVGGTLEITVVDQGAHPPRDLESCFQGPGIGLRVAQAICTRAQGRLEIGPGATSGTRCLVVLPRGIN